MDFFDSVAANSFYIVFVASLGWFTAGLLLGRVLRRPSRRKRKRRRKNPAGNAGPLDLYVGNLPFDFRDAELRRIFAKHGKVVSARVILNKSSGVSKGYGFVQMADRQSVKVVIKALSSHEVQGRRIVVSEARTSSRSR